MFRDVKVIGLNREPIANIPRLMIELLPKRVIVEEPTLHLQSSSLPTYLEVPGPPQDFLTDNWSVKMTGGTVTLTRASDFTWQDLHAVVISDKDKGVLTFRLESSRWGSLLAVGKLECTPDQIDPLRGSLKVRLTAVPLARLEPLLKQSTSIKDIDGFVDWDGEYTIGSRTPFEGHATVELRNCILEGAAASSQRTEFALFNGTHKIRIRHGVRISEIGLHELKDVRLTPGIDLAPLVNGLFESFVAWFFGSPIPPTAPGGNENAGTPSEICAAAFHKDLKQLQDLAAKGANLDEKDTAGFTPLACAVVGECLECVDWLMRQRVSVDRPSDIGELHGIRPLELACNLGKQPIAEHLIRHGASIDHGGYLGRSPLYHASASGHLKLVQYLADRGARIDAADQDGRTPLMAACFSGQAPVVEYLLKAGANSHHSDRKGFTALIAAAQEGHIDVVKMLLANGADPKHVTEEGMTALAAASRDGRENVAMLLIGLQSNVNARNADGYTPLIFASYRGMPKVVRALLENGADPNASDLLGRTSLLAAAGRRHYETASTLLELGADANRGIDGMTPLVAAILVHDDRMVNLLLHGGAIMRSDSDRVLRLVKELVKADPTNNQLANILGSIETKLETIPE